MKKNSSSAPMDEVKKTLLLEDRAAINENSGLTTEQPDWTWFYDMGPALLRELDPVTLIVGQLIEIEEILPQRQALYTVLSELYSNAMEHGVLELDSELKLTEEGFSRYFELREERLKELEEGWVCIRIEKISRNETEGLLRISVEDSGQGFDFNKQRSAVINNEKPSGRGICIIEELCDSVEYTQSGRRADVIYSLRQ